MKYSEALDYLFNQLPMFQRVGAPAYKADLSNTIALCEALGNPQNGIKCIHVAGTNGKGSVSSALASIFQSCGYKTGLFTSPHLLDYRERIRINGELISEESVTNFVERIQAEASQLSPSFFEITCAMAFDYFANEKVDIAIFEVGMGGRLDSTNVISPELSVITSISKDHEQFLGNTLPAIAREKGGIIKPGVPVVVGRNELDVLDELSHIASDRGAPWHDIWAKAPYLETDLTGSYQRENMQVVSKAIEIMRELGWNLPEKKVEEGALRVREQAGLRGRWETIGQNPKIIADVGHNAAGVEQVVGLLRKETFVRLHIVWGMVGDKNAKEILNLLPKSATYYWCKPDVPRGKDQNELQAEAIKFALEGKSYSSVSEALEAAKEDAQFNDLIFVGGSVFVVAEVLT